MRNIRKALRQDDFLLMLEMTEPLVWVDMSFGILERWWLFEDGRHHAIAHQFHWEPVLQSEGYGYVDRTDGNRPEVRIQRLIIAMAFKSRYDRLLISPSFAESQISDTGTRQAIVDEYIGRYTHGFTAPIQSNF